MTNRSKRLEKFLNQSLGWETGSGKWVCSKKCGHYEFDHQNFCSSCGAPMKRDPGNDGVEDDLEEAIKYALGERKKL